MTPDVYTYTDDGGDELAVGAFLAVHGRDGEASCVGLPRGDEALAMARALLDQTGHAAVRLVEPGDEVPAGQETAVADRRADIADDGHGDTLTSLRDRIATALKTHPWEYDGRTPEWAAHSSHTYYGGCAVCRGDVEAMAAAVMGVVAARGGQVQPRTALEERAAGLMPMARRNAELERDMGAVEEENDRLRAALDAAVRAFTHRTHPGQPCLQSGHVPTAIVEQWRRAALGNETAGDAQ